MSITKSTLAAATSLAAMTAFGAAFAANDAPNLPNVQLPNVQNLPNVTAPTGAPSAPQAADQTPTNDPNDAAAKKKKDKANANAKKPDRGQTGGWRPPEANDKRRPPKTNQPKNAAQPTNPQQAAPPQANTPQANPSKANPQQANPQKASGPIPAAFNAVKSARKERRVGKNVVIEEPGNRTIVQQNNRIAIDRDERDQMRRFNPNAKIEKGPGGNSVAIVERGGDKIYSETDDNGRLVRRYRRDASGGEKIIIDNRRRDRNRGRDVATGVAIGAGAVAGAVLLDSLVRVPQPRVTIPREKYIVSGDRASDEDYYEALSAPPVGRYTDHYTLDEIRATPYLRDRMRRIDLDDITFDFGSWEVDPSQYGKLERLARAINRVLRRDPDEVFLIEGHTDAVGSRVDNLTLSDRRADTIAYILTRHFDVPFEALVTQGYGEEYLKIPTQAPERLNRRVAARRITPLLARDDYAPRAERPERYDRVYEKDYNEGPPPPPPPPRDYDERYDGPPGPPLPRPPAPPPY